MLFYLIFFFTVMPLIELYFLIRVGQVIGAWNTVAALLLMGIIGGTIVRNQGQAIWRQVNEKLARGEMPADSLFHGFLVFVGGLLMITPGFVTDLMGLLLVLPGPRHLLLKAMKHEMAKRVARGQVRFYTNSSQRVDFTSGPTGPRPTRDVIDLEPDPDPQTDKGPRKDQ
ncbi:MAG: FxsA family protein [Bdellovibrionales bacterium]|nr:FxsA family protein [Bdellovibrionales bacterium]